MAEVISWTDDYCFDCGVPFWRGVDKEHDEHATLSQAPLPDLWFVKQVQDGEILPDGTGYAGDFEDWPEIVDIEGRYICDCADVEVAREIVHKRNTWTSLLEALDAMLDWALSNRGGKHEFVTCRSGGDKHHPALEAARVAIAEARK